MLAENLKSEGPVVFENTNYQYQILESVSQVNPTEWNQLIDPMHDLAMNQNLIRVMEQSLAKQAKFWTIAIRNSKNELVCCANLSLFEVDVIQSSSFFVKKLISTLRVVRPNTLKWKILFCGLPVPSGHCHLRFAQNVEPHTILPLLNQIMEKLAKNQQAKLIALKEFDQVEINKVKHLRELGFYQSELAPLFILSGSFKDFDEYIAAMRSPYRHQVQNNMKKFNLANLQVEHIFNAEEIKARFNHEVYQLYLNTWKKAKEKLECLPIHFFQELATTLPEQIAFTLISNNDKKPVAFAIGLINGTSYYNLYTGFDYSTKQQSDLYFNLFYHEINCAFQLKKQRIFLGQTSDYFKSRLGATAEPRFFFARAVHPSRKMLLKVFHKFIFPKVPQPIKHDVFKE